MLWILGLHVPGLVALGLALGYTPRTLTLVVIPPLAMVGLGYLVRHHRRPASIVVTIGLVYCSAALVALTHGTIEAHFHFFVIIGFIALYQDWAPFLVNIVFTVISHGIGSAWQQTLIFDHVEGQAHPWLWSLIHGAAVLVACAGALLVLRVTEDTQREKDILGRRLADSEINRRQFTSDLLTNLARRNQSLLHRQLEIINQLEESERDPDALADLFALDHIATRVRRNAENLLVLAGEQPPRTWSEPVPLRDVLRAAIAETENLERVVFVVDEKSAVVGHTVIDLTHLLAELTENAVRFSPSDTTVTVRSRPDRARPGGRLISIEDWGLGMPAEQIEAANALLASPPDIDMAVSQRLGFHVVARLAARHGIKVGLSVTPGSGTTALVSLPPSLFAPLYPTAAAAEPVVRPIVDRRLNGVGAARAATPPFAEAPLRTAGPAQWQGWWDPAVASAMPAFNPTAPPLGGAGAGGNGHTNGAGHHAFADDGGALGGGPNPTANGVSPTTNGTGHSFTNGAGVMGAGASPMGGGAGEMGSGAGPAANGNGSTGGGYHLFGDGDGDGAAGGGDGVMGDGGPSCAGPAANGYHLFGGGTGAGGDDVGPSAAGLGGDGPRTTAHPGLGPGDGTPTYRVSTGSPTPPPEDPTGQPELRRTRPSPSPRPLVVDAAPAPTNGVPEQRPSAPVDPAGGLRRRVPQSHLSAQLRTPEPDPAAAPVLNLPSTADAAAALSRYQASRAAAQARVGSTLPTHPATTDDPVDGVHE